MAFAFFMALAIAIASVSCGRRKPLAASSLDIAVSCPDWCAFLVFRVAQGDVEWLVVTGGDSDAPARARIAASDDYVFLSAGEKCEVRRKDGAVMLEMRAAQPQDSSKTIASYLLTEQTERRRAKADGFAVGSDGRAEVTVESGARGAVVEPVLDELHSDAIGKGLPRYRSQGAEALREIAMEKSGIGSKGRDDAKRIQWLMRAAQFGDADAMLDLAVSFYSGDGAPQDLASAARYFEMAAEKGNADAMFSIGVMHAEGKGVRQDYQIALKWWLAAAGKGNAKAMRNIGSMFFRGVGVEQDYRQAAEWYLKAAGQNDARSMYRIGEMFENGWGVEADHVRARMWYEKAEAALE